jgi:hypothetical protein
MYCINKENEMSKYLVLLLASCSTQAYADKQVDFTKLYPQPQVIYVAPVQVFIPPTPLTPSTYEAPSSTWQPIVTPTPTIDLRVDK